MFHVPLVVQIEYGSVLAHRVNRVIFRGDWRHTVLARYTTQQNVVGESKNMKHVNKMSLLGTEEKFKNKSDEKNKNKEEER